MPALRLDDLPGKATAFDDRPSGSSHLPPEPVLPAADAAGQGRLDAQALS
jgi:hypothetical protein